MLAFEALKCSLNTSSCSQPGVVMTSQVLLSENTCGLLHGFNVLAASAAVFKVARVSRIACNTCHVLLQHSLRLSLRTKETRIFYSNKQKDKRRDTDMRRWVAGFITSPLLPVMHHSENDYLCPGMQLCDCSSDAASA